MFTECLASAPSGSAPGPGGYEMLELCLDESSRLLFRVAEDLARAWALECITRAFMCATMTALQKHDGGVRGIATGTSFRRLITKTLVPQFGKVVEAFCALVSSPSPQGGHRLRRTRYQGVHRRRSPVHRWGCYDHVLRSSFLQKLHSVPSLQRVLPFVRSVCARTTTYECGKMAPGPDSSSRGGANKETSHASAFQFGH